MKNKKYKYLTAISSFAVSVFMLFDWFIIKAMGTQEAHSFITIPSMLTSGADFLKQIGGKTAAIFILIMAGLVEFMCITASVMGIWGGIRCLIKPYKSFARNATKHTTTETYLISYLLASIHKTISTTSFAAYANA